MVRIVPLILIVLICVAAVSPVWGDCDDCPEPLGLSSSGDRGGGLFYYEPVPENSLGWNESLLQVNWTRFWSYLNNHVQISLEGCIPGTNHWIEDNSYLTITRDYSDDMNSCKLGFIVEVPRLLDVRLTVGCDLRVMSYMSRVDQYEYVLNYTSPSNESFSVFFDWEDLLTIPGLVFSHGVRNIDGKDVFWFRLRRDNVPAGMYVFDPTIGYGGACPRRRRLDGQIRGNTYAYTDSVGVARNITAKLRCLLAIPACIYVCMIYEGDTFLGKTEWRVLSCGTDTYYWYTFEMEDTVLLYPGHSYRFVAWGLDGGPAEICYKVGDLFPGSGVRNVSSFDPDNPPDPVTWTTGIMDVYCLYCTYDYVTAPVVSDEIPENNSCQGVVSWCGVSVDDCLDGVMDISWYWVNGSSWEVFGNNLSVGDGSYSQGNSNFTGYGVWYVWGVNVSNSVGLWSNTSYRFMLWSPSVVGGGRGLVPYLSLVLLGVPLWLIWRKKKQ